MKDIINSPRLDANETIYFVEQLNFVKAKAYEKKYPLLKAASGMVIPISQEADSADETITYEYFDKVGMARIIANYADDLPRVDVHGTRFTSNIRGIGDSYEYSIQDIRKGARTGKSLPQRKADAARKGNDQLVDKIAWYGDTEYGLLGLLNNPNITAGVVATGGTSTKKKWAEKLPYTEEILDDMNDAVTDTFELTNGIEIPDTMLLPIAQQALVAKTRLAAGTDTTILQFFLANNPSITTVEWVNEMKAVDPLPSGDTGPKDVMVTYRRDPEYLSLELPQMFEQFPAQEKNLSFVINCHSRCGGVIIPYPLVVRVVEGI